jgi:endonuclease/exonuclease/phosphatase family metal-dependent hydrolase
LNPDFSGSFLEATVLDPAGKEWPIGVLHLPAGATDPEEDARLNQLAMVLDLFKENRAANRPHLLCGDFNSNAPYQHIDPAKCKPKTQQAWEANGLQIPRRVIQTMIDTGYTDTYAIHHNEQFEMIGSFTTQFPGQRVDYIFSFGVPNDRITNAWVEQDRLAKYASDHFPVGVEIGPF